MPATSTARNVLIGVIATIIITLSIGLYFAFDKYQFYKEESRLKDEQISQLNKTIDNKVESDKINDKTSRDVAEKNESRKQEEDSNREAIELEIEKIKKDFQTQSALEQLSEDEAKKREKAVENQVGNLRLQGLWKTYCSSQPNPAQCFEQSKGEVK